MSLCSIISVLTVHVHIYCKNSQVQSHGKMQKCICQQLCKSDNNSQVRGHEKLTKTRMYAVTKKIPKICRSAVMQECQKPCRSAVTENVTKYDKCIDERKKLVNEQEGAVKCETCERWFRSRGGLAVHTCRRPR